MNSEENTNSVSTCFNCNAEISFSDKFCEECGANLKEKVSYKIKGVHISKPSDSLFLITMLYVFSVLSIIGGILLAVAFKESTIGVAIFSVVFIDVILFVSVAKILSKLDFLIKRVD